jgi:hypothetical protein
MGYSRGIQEALDGSWMAWRDMRVSREGGIASGIQEGLEGGGGARCPRGIWYWDSPEEHEKSLDLECSGITEKPWKKIEGNGADVEEGEERNALAHLGQEEVRIEVKQEETHLPQQRDRERGGRDDLGQEQEEHGEREQDGDGEGHLLPRVRG